MPLLLHASQAKESVPTAKQENIRGALAPFAEPSEGAHQRHNRAHVQMSARGRCLNDKEASPVGCQGSSFDLLGEADAVPGAVFSLVLVCSREMLVSISRCWSGSADEPGAENH